MALVALFYGRLRRARASLKAKVEVKEVFKEVCIMYLGRAEYFHYLL